MIQTLVVFKTKEFVTDIIHIAMLVIFKVGTYIPAPGVNPDAQSK